MTDTLDKKLSEHDVIIKAIILGAPGASGLTDCADGSEAGPGKSQQSSQKPKMSFRNEEVVIPKYDPEIWAQMTEINTRLNRAISTYARNTVGLGWAVNSIEPEDDKEKSENAEIVKKQKKFIKKLFANKKGDETFTELMYKVKFDEEAIGNGYLEVVRDGAGRIQSFFHIIGISIRRRIQEVGGKKIVKGFIQIKGENKVYFKEFGDDEVISAKTGKPDKKGEPIPLKDRATEVIHFSIYSPTSTFYGVPRYVSASNAIVGNRLAGLRNSNFFENDAVPRMAVLVSGGMLDAKSIESLQEFFQSSAIKGVQNSGKAIVLQTQQTNKSPLNQQDNNARIELKPLTVGVTEDSSFETYRRANDEEIREAFGIAPVFFSTENVNKASSAVSREITNTQEFQPDRVSKEFRINNKIVSEVLCNEAEVLVEFKFNGLKSADPLEEAKISEIYSRIGGLTPNDIREKLNKPAYDKKFLWADLPLAVVLDAIGSGLSRGKMEQTDLMKTIVEGQERSGTD